MESEYIEVRDLTFHVVSAGERDNPLVILLHGFPEFWKGWEKQIEDIAKAGYFVIVPDQRGYNTSSKPRKVRNYRISELSQDVIAIASYYGHDKFFLAGHDWGAGVAWATALLYPEHIHKLIIVNVPHPISTVKYLRKSWRQKRKSWYMFAFQIPLIPEFLSARFNYRVLVRTMKNSSSPGTFSEEDFDEYRIAWKNKRCLTSMIAWYRAAFRFPQRYENHIVEPPTLIIWGTNDKFLMDEMGEDSLNYCKNAHLEKLDATHWVLHERPEVVNPMIINFLSS